ncbi:MAG: bifunctional phosphoglucose/phosphomannose isomerase [Anaerolineales bacterium]|jgi:glucose/mannose-6-phosphate isomerase
MINLDDFAKFSQLDPSNMLSQIDGLPDQLQNSWELGSKLPLPMWQGFSNILIAGMGGSAIGADLLAAYAKPLSPLPIFVHRDYDLPGWANGPQTLVITSSHSGNTEETLSAFMKAVENKCTLIVVCTGGQLAKVAVEYGAVLWPFEHKGQPRAAVGYSFGLLLAVLSRLNLIPDPSDELTGAIKAMKAQQTKIKANIPVAENPAKRMAGQFVNRWVTVMGTGVLTPVARRWKGQISEIAKAWGQFEFMPEANHNTLAGILNPEENLSRMMVVFLRAPSDHPRNRLRSELTSKAFMLEGIGTDFVDAQGDSTLSHLWTTLHFGDYTAYYLAMAYGVDPTPVEAIESFKREMVSGG